MGAACISSTRKRRKRSPRRRYHFLRDETDSFPWVGLIVNDRRIDGIWTHGRWDLRRKLRRIRTEEGEPPGSPSDPVIGSSMLAEQLLCHPASGRREVTRSKMVQK
jgi:hypothetical protein